MKILIACEDSKAVTIEMRKRGHDAFSCDIIECSGGHPEWHIQGDVLDQLDKGWDIMIAFPPCTFLTVTANRSFLNNPDRWQKRVDALIFVYNLMNAPIEKICIENPKGVIVSHIKHLLFRRPQYIQPYHYGHHDSKMTGLWLKNIPTLIPSEIVNPEWIIPPSGKRMSKTHWENPSTNSIDNSILRSKTYPGIARAMAEQWTEDLTQ